MNYKEAIDFIENIQTECGSDYSLDAVKELCRLAGRPDRKLRVIHIAGTNGKGSVGNYITDILAGSGYTVGRYISPTLFEYRERIQRVSGTAFGVERENISEKEVAACLEKLKEYNDQMISDGFRSATAFEIETVMAFMAMASWKVDVAVVETGLGGRMDATNIIENPFLCVLTTISRDHMGILGSTIQEIAKEKFGIIKHGTNVVSVKQEKSCMDILRDYCLRYGVTLTIADTTEIRQKEYTLKNTSFLYQGEKLSLGQAGVYQIENAVLALEAAKILRMQGMRYITHNAAIRALKESRWPGRFELVSQNPFVLVDGAHNLQAANLLKESLDVYFPGEKFSFITGVFADKEYRQMLKTLLPCARRVYTITAPGKRGLDKEILAETARELGGGNIKDVKSFSSVSAALNKLQSAGYASRTIVFGSLSFLQDVYEYFGIKDWYLR